MTIDEDRIEIVGQAAEPSIEQRFRQALQTASTLDSTSVSAKPSTEGFRIRIETDAATEAARRYFEKDVDE